jgi:1-acyl-sn-glycerol-3-phosphate acyltransferase
MLYWFGKIVITPFFFLIFRPAIHNWKGLRSQGPVMYLCNHFSLADAVALAAISPRGIRFMALESLFQKPLANAFFRSLNMLPAGEGGGSRLGPVKRAIALLQEGHAFGIFPEGHRSPVYTEMDAFEKGAAFIALRANVPIIPIYMDPLSWKRMHLRVTVGERIVPEEVKESCPGQKAVDALTDRIVDTLNTLREETEATYPLRQRRKV